MRDYEYLRLTMESARDERRGKPLENNTRLYRRTVTVEGQRVEAFAVQYHATDIVTVLPDGRALLANGGWRTSTTIQRVRAYGSNHVHTEDGNWYVMLQPDESDPRPNFYRRTIPKPYDEPTDPGPEPVKTATGAIIYGDQEIVFPKAPFGCRAGTTEEYSYEERLYDFQLRDEDRHLGRPVGNRGDRIITRNGVIHWTEHTEWGKPDHQQCKHCKEFEALRHRWWLMEEGGYHRNQHGHKMWREMMERFGTVEAWQEAYIADFRARKDYLKAHREWLDRNRVPFFDGIMVDTDGYAIRPSKAFTKRLAAHERKVARINKRIDKFCALAVQKLKEGLPLPGGGDCWYCSMVTTDEHTGRRVPWGDSADNHEHLEDHIREGYVVPSLLVNALRERGYKDVGIYMILDMDPDNDRMGKESGRYHDVQRDLRSYLKKRLVPQPPTK